MGTDVALMLGIAHTLMTQGKHDKVFLEKYTTGYPQFEEYLTGKSDNTPKSAALGGGNYWRTGSADCQTCRTDGGESHDADGRLGDPTPAIR